MKENRALAASREFGRPIRRLSVLALLLSAVAAAGTADVRRVTIASSPGPDFAYAAGDRISVTVQFDAAVEVTGVPALLIGIGGTERRALMWMHAGSRVHFGYTVRRTDNDSDGISIGAGSLRLRGGRIDGPEGNAANLSLAGHAIVNAPQHRVDGARAWPPSIEAVSVTSNPGVAGAYGVGDVIEVTVEYDEPVFVDGMPSLTVVVGSEVREAPYRKGSGSRHLTFTTRVWADNLADGGIEIRGNGLAGGAGISDADGNVARTDYTAPGIQPDHRVDAVRPRVVGVQVISTPPPGGVYGEGDGVAFAVTFDEDVYWTGPARIPTWPEELASLDYSGYANAIESRGRTIVFRHVVGPGVNSERMQIGRGTSSAACLDCRDASLARDDEWGVSIRDRAGNPASPVFSGSGQFHSVRYDGGRSDTRPPEVDSVSVVSEPRNGTTYRRGEVIAVRVVFTEGLHAAPAGAGRWVGLELAIGGRIRLLGTWVGNGNQTATFTHAVDETDVDADGLTVIGAVHTGPVQDAAGNRASGESLPFEAVRDAGHAVNGALGDLSRPRLLRIAPGGRGLVFDGRVEARGAPQVRIGSAHRPARFGAPRPSFLDRDLAEWSLAYRLPAIAAGDFDRDGASITAEGWAGVTFHDALGRPVAVDPENLVLRSRGGAAIGSAFAGVLLESPAHGGSAFGEGQTLRFDVVFDRFVNVTGAARLKVGVRELPCSPRNGRARHFVCSRIIAPGENAPRVDLTRLALRMLASTITDDEGNAVERDLSAYADTIEPFAIDTSPPRVERLVFASTPAANGSYGARARFDVVVRFNEPVSATGSEQLALEVGGETRLASLAGSAGADGLRFRYVFGASDADADGLSIPSDAIVLNGGAITDLAGNPAVLSHAALGARSAHRVDGGVVDISTTPIRVRIDAPAPALGSPTVAARSSLTWEAASAWSGRPPMAYSVQADHPDVLVGRASGRVRLGQRVTNNLRMRCGTGGTHNVRLTISVAGTAAPAAWDVLCRDGLLRVREVEVFQGPLAGRFRPARARGRVDAIEGRQGLVRVHLEHDAAAAPELAVGLVGADGVEPLEVGFSDSDTSARRRLSRYIVPLSPAQVAGDLALEVVADPGLTLDADVRPLPRLQLGALAPQTLPVFKPVFVPVEILDAAPEVDADALLERARSLLPIAGVAATVREPLVYELSAEETDRNVIDARRLFDRVAQLANEEGAEDEFHVGVAMAPAGWGPDTAHHQGGRVQLVVGDADASESVAVGFGWGFGLGNLPCRTLGHPDFPQEGIGAEGSWSFHEGRFIAPGDGYYDLMSPCAPRHISNYSYREAMAWGERAREAQRRNGRGDSTATLAAGAAGGGEARGAAAPPGPAAARSLSLSGSVDEHGFWSLFAASASAAPPRADAPGGFVLTLHDDSGVEMYRQSLAAEAMGGLAERWAGTWAVRVPMQAREVRAVRVRDASGDLLLDAGVHLPARPPAQVR